MLRGRVRPPDARGDQVHAAGPRPRGRPRGRAAAGEAAPMKGESTRRSRTTRRTFPPHPNRLYMNGSRRTRAGRSEPRRGRRRAARRPARLAGAAAAAVGARGVAPAAPAHGRPSTARSGPPAAASTRGRHFPGPTGAGAVGARAATPARALPRKRDIPRDRGCGRTAVAYRARVDVLASVFQLASRHTHFPISYRPAPLGLKDQWKAVKTSFA